MNTQVWIHREALDDLASAYRSGEIRDDVLLPWSMRYLSVDGRAHARDGTLYIAAWQDWRAETGVGFAYFAEPPHPDATVMTAAGDAGTPTRDLGDGWWWVE